MRVGNMANLSIVLRLPNILYQINYWQICWWNISYTI